MRRPGARGAALLLAAVMALSVYGGLASSANVGHALAPLSLGSTVRTGSVPTASLASPHAAAQAVGLTSRNVVPAGATPLLSTCGGATNWVSGSDEFFTDVNVCFSVPGSPSPPYMPTVPENGTIPEYAPGFYVNVSTNVRILTADICLWATEWPEPGVGAQAVPNFDPADWDSSDCFLMVAGAPSVGGTPTGNPDTASYYVDCYKYFFPGDYLSFYITVTSNLGEVDSNKQVSVAEDYNTGYDTVPTWEAAVEAPFASTNFTGDVRVATTPSVLTTPAFDPNPDQTTQVYLTSFNASGGPATPIPAANATVGILLPGSGIGYAYSDYIFGPANNTTMWLTTPIPKQVGGTIVTISITIFLYWDGLSRIDEVTSQTYNFTTSMGGTFPEPNSPLEENAQISTYPNVLTPGETYLPTGTPVNVTVHEARENVTFDGAEVDFQFHDHGASVLGSVPMKAISLNTSYAVLPGLPPSSSLTFSVVARDISGNPDSSGNYTYAENGTSVPTPPTFTGFFYVEVYDVATNELLPGRNFTISNLTWFQGTQTNFMGVGTLQIGVGGQPLFLAYGSYLLTVHALGVTVARQVEINSPTPFTVVFYVSTGTVALLTHTPPSVLFEISGTFGLVAAAGTVFVFRPWFKDRRAKAEAEQRRVTL